MFSVLTYKLKYKEEPWDTLNITPETSKEDALDAFNWKIYYFPHFLGIIGVNGEDFVKYSDAYNSYIGNYDSTEQKKAFVKKNLIISLILSTIGFVKNKEKIIPAILDNINKKKPEKKLKKKSKK